MEYLSVSKIAKKWNLSTSKVRKMCEANQISGILKYNKHWIIPDNVPNPICSNIDINSDKPTKMNNLKGYITSFFDTLEMQSDKDGEHSYNAYISGAINEFLDNESKETAFNVYQTFFDCYRVKGIDVNNPFIDLLDTLKNYEENAATLTDRQRDHYIHSVNVFLLGLAIYSQNTNYQSIFNEYNKLHMSNSSAYNTIQEEFFYRWGLASLFHDVGYPAEITTNQINKFFSLVTSMDACDCGKVHTIIEGFDAINSIPKISDDNSFTVAYSLKYNSDNKIDVLCPTDLLAIKLHQSFDIDLDKIKLALKNYIVELSKLGYVDHGFYSSFIVLKWYGNLMQKAGCNPDEFYYPILDSASAILLHNYYKNYMCKGKCFNHGPLSPIEHPIAWLLILSDEMQEWNREAYGILDKKKTLASEAAIFIGNLRLDITYLSRNKCMNENFSQEKENDFSTLLKLDEIFTNGFTVGCEVIDSLTAMSNKLNSGDKILPRPLIENIEKLAIGIHDTYNQKQLAINPNAVLEYPRFSDLPDSIKYSNLRQARDIVNKLDLIGCVMLQLSSGKQPLSKFTEYEVEFLSVYEHESWMAERIESGWSYGDVKDTVNKKSPYLVPYKYLSEEIKDLDRDTVRNIPNLLKLVGMGAYRKDTQ